MRPEKLAGLRAPTGSCLLPLTGCWAMPKHPHSLSISRAEPGRQDWRGRVEVDTIPHGARACWGTSSQVICACHSSFVNPFSARPWDTRMMESHQELLTLSVLFSFPRHCQHLLRPPPPRSPSRLPHRNRPPSTSSCPLQHPGPWYLPLTASSSGLWPSSS